ncbi:hypothetical protein SAMN05421743_10698 [Thalassobacillus cyri]|uniref:YhhN-like protein n=1 Tax=Thalassobacillus cyri TaxID=571932 RepID=A0A1H4CLC1_9BACI|nr:hypothetical protein [Thalassobacillus cyri]SEA61120.1 hypothetical protein SAMN05421743_10698 [Thalassobacillus cyri]
MDVAAFYWFSWVTWIGVVFFYNDDDWKPIFSIGLLGFIFLSDSYAILHDVAFSWAFILMWCGSLWFLMKIGVTALQMVYMLLYSIMLASIQLFIFLNPVWSLFPTEIILVMLSVLMFKILDGQMRNRIFMFVFFASTGSFISSYILYLYGIVQVIGSASELIFIMKGVFIFLLIYGLQVTKKKIALAANEIKMRTERFEP